MQDLCLAALLTVFLGDLGGLAFGFAGLVIGLVTGRVC